MTEGQQTTVQSFTCGFLAAGTLSTAKRDALNIVRSYAQSLHPAPDGLFYRLTPAPGHTRKTPVWDWEVQDTPKGLSIIDILRHAEEANPNTLPLLHIPTEGAHVLATLKNDGHQIELLQLPEAQDDQDIQGMQNINNIEKLKARKFKPLYPVQSSVLITGITLFVFAIITSLALVAGIVSKTYQDQKIVDLLEDIPINTLDKTLNVPKLPITQWNLLVMRSNQGKIQSLRYNADQGWIIETRKPEKETTSNDS